MNVIDQTHFFHCPVGVFNRYSVHFDEGNNYVNGTYIYA